MLAFILLLFLRPVLNANEPLAFSFHLFHEPAQLDPQLVSSASGSYLQTNLFRGLFRYNTERGLIPEMAKKCTRSPLRLTCQLKNDIRWSDGSPIVAADFVRAFANIVDPNNKNLIAGDLFTLRNAKAIWAGSLPVSQLGVLAIDEQTLQFDFERADYEFEYKLIHPAFSPRKIGNNYDPEKATHLIVNGPYKISKWSQGQQIKLVANKYYDTKPRPDTLIYFIDSDSTALRLYESGKLTLLRRLAAIDTPRFKDSKELFRIPMARFDYIGFSEKLRPLPQVRQALSQSLDFPQFRELFDASGTPGCPSLPARWLDRVPCKKAAMTQAKTLWSKSKSSAINIEWSFGISQLGGEDISRAAEWFQRQWSKNLNLLIPIQTSEQGTYLQRLKNNPSVIFRKGVGLDRPTCSAALEIFTKNSPENYIRFNDAEYERLYAKILQTPDRSLQRILCRRAVERLLEGHWIIPLGEMHFVVLARSRFKGWHINELNQLDLTDLHIAPLTDH